MHGLMIVFMKNHIRSQEHNTPDLSRVNVGKMLPLIQSGLQSESLICRMQHLLTERVAVIFQPILQVILRHIAELQHHLYLQYFGIHFDVVCKQFYTYTGSLQTV